MADQTKQPRTDNQEVHPLAQALENFLSSPDFEAGVISSTKAGWGGSGYSVELFEDGTYRVLWDNSIGNLYQTPGVILGLPKIPEDYYQGVEIDWHDLFGYNEFDQELRDALALDLEERAQAEEHS